MSDFTFTIKESSNTQSTAWIYVNGELLECVDPAFERWYNNRTD